MKHPAFPTCVVLSLSGQTDRLFNGKNPLRSVYGRGAAAVIEVCRALHTIPPRTERRLAQIDEVKASEGFPK